MSQNEVTYDFKNGDKHTYYVLSASDVLNDQLIADDPGLYAWYVRLDRAVSTADELSTYAKIFFSKQYTVSASANLGEKYMGGIRRASAFEDNPPVFAPSVISASTIFAPPIYIGISGSIRTRLRQHLQHLTDALGKPIPSPSGNANQIDFDTDQESESQYFGERIASLLLAQNIRYTNGLFVKVMYQPVSKTDLLRAESFINRTFVPLCGRR